jgi:hypothetical protein
MYRAHPKSTHPNQLFFFFGLFMFIAFQDASHFPARSGSSKTFTKKKCRKRLKTKTRKIPCRFFPQSAIRSLLLLRFWALLCMGSSKTPPKNRKIEKTTNNIKKSTHPPAWAVLFLAPAPPAALP